jgi:hypothetical protein
MPRFVGVFGDGSVESVVWSQLMMWLGMIIAINTARNAPSSVDPMRQFAGCSGLI